MKTSQKGLYMVVISGVVFGLQPIAVSFCYTQGANPTILLILRFLVLIIALFPGILKSGGIIRHLKKNGRQLFMLSLASAVTPLLLFSAYNYLATGLVTTLHFMYPVLVALICLIFFHDILSRLRMICLALCLAGMLLLLDTFQGSSLIGIALALASGVTYSIYIVGLDKFQLEGMSSTQILFFIETFNLLLIGGIYSTLTNSLFVSITPLGWTVAFLISIVVGIFGHLFFLIGVRYTEAQTASIASTMEPITSILIGVLFMGEPFNLRIGAGTIMILSAVILLSIFDKKPAESSGD